MSPTRKEILERWDKVINQNLDELKEILSTCGEKQTVILRSHLFAEQVLEKIINQEFSEPEYILEKANFSFFEKLCLVRGIGEFNKQNYDSFLLLNKTRNKFAHDINFELDEQRIDDLGRTLGKEKFNSLKEFSNSRIHLLVLVVHEICKKGLIMYSLNKSIKTA